MLSEWLHLFGGEPCFRIYGKARPERGWRTISVFATHRRDMTSRWPLWAGTCITWTSEVIVVGWDFAEMLYREQVECPASREYPVSVMGGRIRDGRRRAAVGGVSCATASEIMAHECGHTRQALRLGLLYLPFVGAVTLCREGDRPWNHFENDASEQGLFGGFVQGGVHNAILERVTGTF